MRYLPFIAIISIVLLCSCSWTYDYSEMNGPYIMDSLIFRNGHKYRRFRENHYIDCGISDWGHGDTSGCYICSKNAHYLDY